MDHEKIESVHFKCKGNSKVLTQNVNFLKELKFLKRHRKSEAVGVCTFTCERREFGLELLAQQVFCASWHGRVIWFRFNTIATIMLTPSRCSKVKLVQNISVNL